jgi:hypothetical protein
MKIVIVNPSLRVKSSRHTLKKCLGMVKVCFEVTDELLMIFIAFVIYGRKEVSTKGQYISYS